MDYWSSWCKSTKTLDGFTVVITGGNTGIGKETALDLFRRGARVILASRNLGKNEMAKKDILKQINDEHKGSVATEKLDLSSLQSVRECASRILASEAKIDILINNAGIVMAPKSKTEDGYEIHIGTNHFGHALFTLLLLPRILESAPARIVTVASVAYMLSNFDLEDVNIEKSFYLPMKAYARSKAANILFSRALHLKLRLTSRNGEYRSGEAFGKIHFFGMTWLANVMRWFIRSPRSGAQTTLYCAIDDACANESGLYYELIPTAVFCPRVCHCVKKIKQLENNPAGCMDFLRGFRNPNCGVSRTYWQCSDDASALKLWDLTLEKLDLQDPFKTN